MSSRDTAMIDVEALEAELEKIEGSPEWGQGPGSEYYRQVELDLATARANAGLPSLNYTYIGLGYPLTELPAGTGLAPLGAPSWPSEAISGAFGIAQRLGDGSKIVAVILDNGEGKRWMATNLECLEKVA